MEGLFAVIFIVIGIANAVMKQQKQNQGRNSRNRPVSTGQQRRYNTHQPQKTVPVFTEKPAEKLNSRMEYMPSQTVWEESEGIEIEDRRRTGSMDYVEESKSSEGVCNEHPEHERKPAAQAEIIEEELVFDLTEVNLLTSIVMSEVIGPPRALRKSIR